MVATKLVKSKISVDGAILGVESQDLSVTAEDLATIGFTIPDGCTEIVVVPAATMYWHPTGTPSSSFGHEVGEDKMDVVTKQHFAAAKFRSASATPALICVYMG